MPRSVLPRFDTISSSVLLPSNAIVVGIPTRNEEATIGRVVKVAIEGLRDAGLMHRALIVNADNGSTDRTVEVFAAAASSTSHMCAATPASGSGKGSNVLAILQIARHIDAERILLFDADVRTIQPNWVSQFLAGVDGPEPAMAVPIYSRNRYEGNTTNHIASPLLAAVFGVHVQQPIAGDFAFNRAFIERALEWTIPESAELYGIDIHLTANAARENLLIRQVQLGQKLHNPGFPKILFGSQQVIDSLFHVISASGGRLRSAPSSPQPRLTADPMATKPNSDLVAHTVARVQQYVAQNMESVSRLFPAIAATSSARWGFRVDARSWAEILGDALEGLAAGHHTEVRDHLVALYLYRVMTYWEEIEHCMGEQVDALLDEQTDLVIAEVARRGLRFSPDGVTQQNFVPGYWQQNS